MIPEGFPAGFSFKARAALLLAALMTLSLTIFGQTSSGEVNGAVTDQSGAAISAATVKLINQATGIETQASLNKDGRHVRQRQAGNIRPARGGAGFKTAQTPAFNVAVSQTVTQDLELTAGDVSQTVEVSAVGELVQRSSVELGTVISEERCRTCL